MTKTTTAPSKSTKPSSNTVPLITKKLNFDRQINKPDPFYQESPKHQGGPSLSEEEEHAEAKKSKEKPSDYDKVSREFWMEGEGNEEDEDKGETEWIDEDKASKMDGTEEVSKVADPVTLEELLEQARDSRASSNQ